MKHMITDIYRIDTMNSTYEIKVLVIDGKKESVCKKMGSDQQFKPVSGGIEYLEKLCIGPSFLVPGVVQTSNVQDYAHFVLSTEPKRKARRGSETGIPEFFRGLADHVIEVAGGGAVVMQMEPEEGAREYKGYGPGCSENNHIGGCTCDLPPTCSVEGCTYSSKGGPSHDGARLCKSGSIASGGTRAHCSCDYCY